MADFLEGTIDRMMVLLVCERKHLGEKTLVAEEECLLELGFD